MKKRYTIFDVGWMLRKRWIKRFLIEHPRVMRWLINFSGLENEIENVLNATRCSPAPSRAHRGLDPG